MSAIAMRKGQNAPLATPAGDQCRRVQVILKWADAAAKVDVDVSALLLGHDGKVRSDDDLVFYNSPVGADGAVRLVGKSSSEDGSEDRVAIDVEALPGSVHQVAIAASLDAEDGTGFGVLDALSVSIVDASGDVLLSYDIADASTETAFVFGELYLRAEQWKFRAVGQGWDSGLAGLATDYGITIAEAAASDPGVDASEDSTGSEFAEGMTDLGDAGVPVAELAVDATVVETGSTMETQPANGSPDLAHEVVDRTVGGTVAVLAARRVRPKGVQTQKTRPRPAPLPVLTLGAPTWSAARLFSIYGVGALDEQEKRATAALLSTVMAVKEFGRSIVSRLGGPTGLIETYQEVQFKLGERSVSPDGVIRVGGRGGKVWTALLETKTGTNPLRAEQIESYVEVAIARGFDAVVTLSNEIALVGGDHPAAVDRRRLKKVALQHISWAEVLHEAKMQLSHRGVEDRQQAWVLNELIRYLEHPRSGAAGFEDMGASWVPIREAIHAGTLRPSNTKIVDVVRSWDKLTRHLCMRLTSQLGVNTTTVLPRQLSSDASARVAAAVARLVSDGTLTFQVKIQQAVGVLDVSADLRTNRVRVAVDVDAPKEGGASRRVNWLLRQLKTAPDNVSVEVMFARKDITACELLKDLRESNIALLPDPAAEVRQFRLSETFPLGQKRNGLKSAFIPSVNAAVDSFYATVVQGLKPWAKPAAKLPADVAEEAAETIESLDAANAEAGEEAS